MNKLTTHRGACANMLSIILGRHINFIFIIILLSGIGLCGCQPEHTRDFHASKNDYGSRTDSKSELLEEDRLYGPTILGGNNHQNQKLQYSQELSTALSDMPGIFSGIVMQTDKNAYAALIYDNSATGSKGIGSHDESDHRGTTRGMYDVLTGDQTIDPNQIATGINSYYTEKKPENLSDVMKQQIALTLRKKNPQLLEVYITANREFVNQMNVYYTESAHGVDLNNYLGDFNKLVTQHFGVTK
jgi:hypothetical protein